MPEKDPFNYSWITYSWVLFISAWGGAVSFMHKYKEGVVRPFNFMELIGELLTSAFIGMITFFLCEWSETPPLLSAALIGISGHMGSRGLFQLEQWATKKYARFSE